MKKYTNQPDEPAEDKVLHRAFSGSIVKEINKDKRQIEFVISTDDVDRMGDIIDVNGWDLKSYKKNPVVLFGHDSRIPPIGKAIKTWKADNALRSIAEFMPGDISAFAHSIFRMYEEKFLRAVSVGFKPLKWEWMADEEDKITGGIHFKKQELLEFSAVPIPANPEALIAARHKGIDTDPIREFAEEMLDKWNNVEKEFKDVYGVSRKEMEMYRRRAAGNPTSYKVPLDQQDEMMERNLKAVRDWKENKEKAKTVDINVRGIDFSLPVVDKKSKDNAGEILVSTEEINGEKNITVDKADDSCMFSHHLLDDENNEHFSVELREVEDSEEKNLIVTFKGSDKTIEYELTGISEKDELYYGMKISEEEVSQDDDEDEGNIALEDDNEEEDNTDDEDDNVDDDDDEDDDQDDDDDEDEDEDDDNADDKSAKGGDKPKPKPTNKPKPKPKPGKKPKPKPKPDDDDDEKGNSELSFKDQLQLIEEVMLSFEESLDNSSKNLNRHAQRKMEFLASYMRELSDRLDGGKGKETGKSTGVDISKSNRGVDNENEGALSPEEAQDHIKSLAEGIQPVITDMIKARIGKAKGRLD